MGLSYRSFGAVLPLLETTPVTTTSKRSRRDQKRPHIDPPGYIEEYVDQVAFSRRIRRKELFLADMVTSENRSIVSVRILQKVAISRMKVVDC